MASTKTVVEVPSSVEDGSAAVPSAHELLKWVYWGRVTVAVGIFVAAALSFNVVSAGIIVVLSVAALLSVGVSGASVWYTHIRRCTPGRTFLYGQALFDLGLVTTVVHLTEGPASLFPALYILIIAVSAVLMPLQSSLLVTALASLLYFADIALLQPVSLTVAAGLQIVVFAAVFLVTGLIGSRVRTADVAREVLQQEVRRLRLEAADILRNIQSGVITVDGAGELVYANPAALKLLEWPQKDVLGVALESVLGVRSPELRDVILETQSCRLGTLRAEVIVVGSENTFPIGVTTTALDVAGEDFCSVAAIFTDISDQKRLDELRLRTERLEAVAELSASLAHEIKNPLASIRSSVEQLSRSTHANEDERFLAGLVVRESDRLSGLLSEFLDFSRVRVTDCVQLDLETVVRDAVGIVQKHPDCSHGTSIEVVAQSATVEGDEDLLHRILMNLVLNAVQVSEGAAQITIEARAALPSELPSGHFMNDPVLLRVSDDGPGIPEEVRERLFEPFVSARVGGSGLGLAIVQRAVLAHRGIVFVDSEPGVRTSFTVLLPGKRTTEVMS
jgi:two-component system, NtrC family, sensor histidine kinase PilS